MFPRDIVCLRNMSLNTLHKGDDDDDNDNDDNNNNPAASTSSPEVTCSVSPTCCLTQREVAIGILAKSDLLYFVSQRPFLHRFEHFVGLWETMLTYAKFQVLAAVLLNSHLAVSFRYYVPTFRKNVVLSVFKVKQSNNIRSSLLLGALRRRH